MKITESVFLEVFEKFKNTVYSVVFNYVKNVDDAADLQQEVFLKLLGSDAEYESEEHMKAWLIRVSINLCKNHLRSRSRFSDAPLSEEIPMKEEEQSNELFSMVLKLPEKYRVPLHLFYYEANQTDEDGGFKIDFIGITGDKSMPKMFFDVYVEDGELADDYDEIGLYASSFGKTSADSEEIEYMLPVALGEKDSGNENLYHVTLEGGTVRMPSGQPMRLVVTQVVFNPTQSDITIYDVNIEFTMDVPSTTFHSAEQVWYESRPFTYDDYTYYLNCNLRCISCGVECGI